MTDRCDQHDHHRTPPWRISREGKRVRLYRRGGRWRFPPGSERRAALRHPS